MGLQAFGHGLAHGCYASRLSDGGQLPPTGQEESYSCVHRHRGTVKPQNLRRENAANDAQSKKKKFGCKKNKKQITNLTCPKTLGSDVLTETWKANTSRYFIFGDVFTCCKGKTNGLKMRRKKGHPVKAVGGSVELQQDVRAVVRAARVEHP